MLEMLTKILYFVQNKLFNIIYLLICWQSKFGKKFFYPYLCPKGHTITPKLNFCPWCCKKVLLSSIQSYQMFGAKLSWCQIVRCQIVLVPNCPGAKLSTFIILVPNCPLLLSWCQIVPFIILVPNCPVPNCPVPNCPTIKIRYHIFHFKHIHPQNEKQKKTIFHFNENSNRFQS